MLVYVYAFAIGYSYYRRGELEVLFLTQRRDKLLGMEKCPKCGVLLEVIECCGGALKILIAHTRL